MKNFVIYIVISVVSLGVCMGQSVNQSITVTDCQGHTYPVVKIGEQYWMAENLQCTKYDTQSENPNQLLSTSCNEAFSPCYIDGRNVKSVNSYKLTDAQREKLGLLYNWASAMGIIKSPQKVLSKTDGFRKQRQGICPNGYHIPTIAEFEQLEKTLYPKHEVIRRYVSTQKLKADSGWANDGDGFDEFNFESLPAGIFEGNKVIKVGDKVYYWTATPYCRNNWEKKYYKEKWRAYTLDKKDNEDHFVVCNKKSGLSVRCVKN